jgi:hypothetical protein
VWTNYPLPALSGLLERVKVAAIRLGWRCWAAEERFKTWVESSVRAPVCKCAHWPHTQA